MMDYAEEMKITASTYVFLRYNCVGENLQHLKFKLF